MLKNSIFEIFFVEYYKKMSNCRVTGHHGVCGAPFTIAVSRIISKDKVLKKNVSSEFDSSEIVKGKNRKCTFLIQMWSFRH